MKYRNLWKFRPGHWVRAQHKEDGTCLLFAWKKNPTQEKWQLSLQSSSWRHSIQSFSICLWLLPSHCPSVRAQVSTCEWMHLFMHSLRGHLGFLQSSIPPGWSGSPLFLTARCHRDSSSQHQYSRKAWCRAEVPHFSMGNLRNQDIPPNFQQLHRGLGPALLSLHPSSKQLLRYIVSYQTSVQLVLQSDY